MWLLECGQTTLVRSDKTGSGEMPSLFWTFAQVHDKNRKVEGLEGIGDCINFSSHA